MSVPDFITSSSRNFFNQHPDLAGNFRTPPLRAVNAPSKINAARRSTPSPANNSIIISAHAFLTQQENPAIIPPWLKQIQETISSLCANIKVSGN